MKERKTRICENFSKMEHIFACRGSRKVWVEKLWFHQLLLYIFKFEYLFCMRVNVGKVHVSIMRNFTLFMDSFFFSLLSSIWKLKRNFQTLLRIDLISVQLVSSFSLSRYTIHNTRSFHAYYFFLLDVLRYLLIHIIVVVSDMLCSQTRSFRSDTKLGSKSSVYRSHSMWGWKRRNK